MSLSRLLIVIMSCISVAAILASGYLWFIRIIPRVTVQPESPARLWNFQSIDTTKFSRDLAREKAAEPAFDAVIDQQIKSIFVAGASHVAIGTPYDEEFLPYLRRWIAAIRRYRLKVWFRGNWSGWEGWFGYPRITRAEHIRKTTEFIGNHTDLFENGDLFTACPECENGGPGDPRSTGDSVGHRKFLIEEYAATKLAFKRIGRNIQSNLLSMNADVGAIIMDPSTTTALGGVVTLDHYVRAPADYRAGIEKIIAGSRGKIVIGEFGAPIPVVHGAFTEEQQAAWLKQTLDELARIPEVIGINYWVGFGGSTAVWNPDGRSREALEALVSFYQPQSVSGIIRDELDRPIENARIATDYRAVYSAETGFFQIASVPKERVSIDIRAPGFIAQKVIVNEQNKLLDIKLVSERKSLLFKALIELKKFWK